MRYTQFVSPHTLNIKLYSSQRQSESMFPVDAKCHIVSMASFAITVLVFQWNIRAAEKKCHFLRELFDFITISHWNFVFTKLKVKFSFLISVSNSRKIYNSYVIVCTQPVLISPLQSKTNRTNRHDSCDLRMVKRKISLLKQPKTLLMITINRRVNRWFPWIQAKKDFWFRENIETPDCLKHFCWPWSLR